MERNVLSTMPFVSRLSEQAKGKLNPGKTRPPGRAPDDAELAALAAEDVCREEHGDGTESGASGLDTVRNCESPSAL